MEVVARATEDGKFSANWEGSYKVASQVRPSTYRLETTNGSPMLHRYLTPFYPLFDPLF